MWKKKVSLEVRFHDCPVGEMGEAWCILLREEGDGPSGRVRVEILEFTRGGGASLVQR
jgi:hypothetical protein